jgi:hypothetical protein
MKTMFGFSAATVRVVYPTRIAIAMWNGRSRIGCSVERVEVRTMPARIPG